MENFDRVRDAVGDYIYENGQEYNRLLVSADFFETLKKEAEEGFDLEADDPAELVDFPRLEVKENADYDFKLLP
ncbi:MAG: hypothetical protein U5K31_15235 [Balneolaceae bacterium]|nr:hypothetical protein [Balneolaceae bacterium]